MKPTSRFGSFAGSRRGSSLLVAGVFALVIGAGVSLMVSQTTTQMTNLFRTRVVENSLAGAQAVLGSMSADVLFIMNNRPPQTGGSIAAIQTVLHQMRPSSLTGYEAVRQGTRPLTYIRDAGQNDFQFRVIDDAADRWNGYSTARLDYEIVAAVREMSGNADRLGVKGIAARKRLTLDYVPLYQFAIFYHPDLELHPGPAMDVRGPVHTNGILWLGSANSLNFHSRVTATGDIRAYNDFSGLNINAKAGDQGYLYPLEGYTNYGNVNFKNAAGAWQNMLLAAGHALDTNRNRYLDSLDANWQSDALSRWGGNVRDQAHGTRPINPPLPVGSDASEMIARLDPADSQAVRDMKFENMADLRITGNPGQPDTIRITDSNGNVIPNRGSNGQDIWSIGEFYDGQQETVVRTIDINMGNLVARGLTFQNGVLYASTTPGSGDNWTAPTSWAGYGRNNFMPAIRVTNAANLPRNLQQGFTLATDRPLYTVGNVNSGSSPATAVFAADSVTVLSQSLRLDYPVPVTVNGKVEYRSSLDNSKAFPLASSLPAGYTREGTPSGVTDPLTGRSVTTGMNPSANPPSGSAGMVTNLILMMGQTGSRFNAQGKRITQSGGAHNVMRYLENWSNKVHTFNGSLICLYESLAATRPWRNDSGFKYYDPPNRNYTWDNRLQTATPPPGMPMFLVINEGAVERVSIDYARTNLPSS